MKSWIAVAAVALIPVAAATVGAFEDETPDTEAIMKALFKKGSGKFGTILKKQVEASPTDWPAVQKTTKEIAELGGGAGEGRTRRRATRSRSRSSPASSARTPRPSTRRPRRRIWTRSRPPRRRIGGSCKSCHDVAPGPVIARSTPMTPDRVACPPRGPWICPALKSTSHLAISTIGADAMADPNRHAILAPDLLACSWP